ncbi:MAG: ABC transporter ATP-binding protein [Sedimentisphaerales bacterium]|nr:ABC transporter ATP-binding protein [Sedimentisphaerales bacterium]
MANVVFDNVSKNYDDLRAIDRMSFEIYDMEFFVILGQSGAGKTTTLKMVAGIEPASEGTILIGGNPINHLTPEKRNVAMVFESYALYPHLSVYDNIAFPFHAPENRKSNEDIEHSVKHIACMLGIDQLLGRKPSELSGGQRQRVALGRALVRRPSVFLMDEPLSHLDAKLRNQMRKELKSMRKSFGTTILYVTHDYNEAMALGDRIAILHKGKIQQIDTPDDIYYHPGNIVIAQSLGDPPMNFLSGELSFLEERFSLRTKNLFIPLDFVRRQDLKSHIGKSVTLGIRPNHIQINTDKSVNSFQIPATVFVQEYLGDDSIISVKIEDAMFMILSTPEKRYAIDENVFLSLNQEHTHLFLSETGESLQIDSGKSI